MKKQFSLIRQFNWKILLMRILVNAVALLLIALLIPKVYFVDKTLVSVLIAAAVLGVLNAFIKPLLLFLTAQLFFATYGLLVIVINTALLYLLKWLLPERFAVDGFLWALIAGLLLGLLTSALENLLGVTPPIVSEEDAEIREQIRKQSVTPLQTMAGMAPATVRQDVETQSIEEVQAAKAALETIQASKALAAADEPPGGGELLESEIAAPIELPPLDEEDLATLDSDTPGGQA